MTPAACSDGCSWLLAQDLSDNLSQKIDILFKVTPPVQRQAASNIWLGVKYKDPSPMPQIWTLQKNNTNSVSPQRIG